jgi:hypothetical protein
MFVLGIATPFYTNTTGFRPPLRLSLSLSSLSSIVLLSRRLSSTRAALARLIIQTTRTLIARIATPARVF